MPMLFPIWVEEFELVVWVHHEDHDHINLFIIGPHPTTVLDSWVWPMRRPVRDRLLLHKITPTAMDVERDL